MEDNKLTKLDNNQLQKATDALAVTDKVLSNDDTIPKEAEILYEQADKNFDDDNYDLAIELLTKAISIYPKYVRAFNLRGLTNQNKKNFTEAMTDFNKIGRAHV